MNKCKSCKQYLLQKLTSIRKLWSRSRPHKESAPRKLWTCSLPQLIAAKDWQAAAEKLSGKPMLASKADNAGCFPLHRACEGGAPPDFIRALIEAAPPATINTKNKHGHTPLDLALEKYPFSENPQDYRDVIDMLQKNGAK